MSNKSKCYLASSFLIEKRFVAMHAELGLLHSRIFSAKVCFLHGMVPRGATVRARTEVDAIAIPPSAAWRSVLKDPGKCMKIVLVSLAVMEQHSVLSASTRNVPPNFRCLVYHRFLRSSLIRWSLTPLHCTLVSLEVTRRKDLVAGMWGISSPHWIQWSNGADWSTDLGPRFLWISPG